MKGHSEITMGHYDNFPFKHHEAGLEVLVRSDDGINIPYFDSTRRYKSLGYSISPEYGDVTLFHKLCDYGFEDMVRLDKSIQEKDIKNQDYCYYLAAQHERDVIAKIINQHPEYNVFYLIPNMFVGSEEIQMEKCFTKPIDFFNFKDILYTPTNTYIKITRRPKDIEGLKDIVFEDSTWEDVGILVPNEEGIAIPYMEDQTKFKFLQKFSMDDEHSFFGGYHGTLEDNIRCYSFIRRVDYDSFWEWLDDFYKRADALIAKIIKDEFHRKGADYDLMNHLPFLANTVLYKNEAKALIEEYNNPLFFTFDIRRADLVYFDPVVEDGQLTLVYKKIAKDPKASLEDRKKYAREAFDREVKRAQGKFASDDKYSHKEFDLLCEAIANSSYNEVYIVSLCSQFGTTLLKKSMITKTLDEFTYDDYYKCNSRKQYFKIIKG